MREDSKQLWDPRTKGRQAWDRHHLEGHPNGVAIGLHLPRILRGRVRAECAGELGQKQGLCIGIGSGGGAVGIAHVGPRAGGVVHGVGKALRAGPAPHALPLRAHTDTRTTKGRELGQSRAHTSPLLVLCVHQALPHRPCPPKPTDGPTRLSARHRTCEKPNDRLTDLNTTLIAWQQPQRTARVGGGRWSVSAATSTTGGTSAI